MGMHPDGKKKNPAPGMAPATFWEKEIYGKGNGEMPLSKRRSEEGKEDGMRLSDEEISS